MEIPTVAQQLKDMLTLFSDMSSTEQQDLIRDIRKRKHETKPAVQKHKRAAGKPTRAKAEKLLSQLSAEQLAELLKSEGFSE